ncbi:MAG: T9SS type A sorting domain-containing protein [Saprospiraceae bacterium]
MTIKTTVTFILLLQTFQMGAHNIVPFWKEDFSTGQLPFGWQSVDSGPNNPTLWKHCNDFNECPPISFEDLGVFPKFRFHSESMDNGFVYIEPHSFGGTHSSTLTTNAIDCSSNDQVFLTFNTYIVGQFNNLETKAIVEVRKGNLGNWTTFTVFPNLNPQKVEHNPMAEAFDAKWIDSYNGQSIILDISQVAAGESEVYIRWRWDWNDEDELFWLIDDVNLLDENPLNENAIWGMAPTEGDFLGGLNGWTVPFVFNCSWVWSENGLLDTQDNDTLADLYNCSCTASDGAMVMDALCNFPDPTPSLTELISPVINLSSADPNKRKGVRFTQAGLIGNNAGNDLPLTSLMVSIDGGLNFIDTVFLNLTEPFQKPFCKTKTVPLPWEANIADELVFKFVFSGNSYFWIIDDVRVVELYENDLQVSEDFFAVAPNYSIAASMIEPMEFIAEVKNVGNARQEVTNLFVEIFNDFNHESVFKDTLFIGVLEPGEASETIAFSKKFIPKQGFAYTGYYTVLSENVDENKRDNMASFQFKTTGNVLSKNIDRFSISSGFTPESQNLRYEIGNCFFIPPNTNLEAVAVTFALANAKQIADEPTNVRINLYQWKNVAGTGDINGDYLANDNEYVKLAEETYTLADNTLLMWDTINVTFSSPVTLDDSCYYFATVEYYDPAIFNGHVIPFFISGSEEINYNAMFYQSESTELPRYVSMLRLFGSPDFQVNGWGLMRVPFVQLKVDFSTAVNDPEEEPISFNLYPNPSAGQIYLSLADDQNRGKIAYEIYDICGRLVLARQNVMGYVSHLPIDISHLGNGLYNLRVISGSKMKNQLFVKSD